MRRQLTRTFGSLALGLLTGTALAAEPAKKRDDAPMIMATAEPAKATLPAEVPVTTKDVGQAPVGQTPVGQAPVVQAPTVACNGNDCGEKKGCHFYAGAGIYLLKPYYEFGNTAFSTFLSINNVAPAANVSISRDTNFHDEYDFAPLVWVGMSDPSGLGVRARWWQWDQENSLAATFGPVPANQSLGIFAGGGEGARLSGTDTATLGVDQHIKIQVWDLEVTQNFRCGSWAMQVAGGARYARLDQQFASLLIARLTGEGQFISADFENNTFRGVGPTVALEGKRALGDTGIALFAQGRASMLFGTNRESDLDSFRFVSDAGIVQADFAGDELAEQKTIMPIAELELGVEWSKSMDNMRPFVRVGAVSQTWFGAGTARFSDGDLGFFGLTASAGLTY